MITQAVILAAGKGKRMRTGTIDEELLNTPKPLLRLGEKTLIGQNVAELSKRGIETIVVINKKDEKAFKKALSDYSSVKFIYQKELLGTANALNAARNMIRSDPFLVLMGDDLIRMDFDALLKINEPTVFGYEVADVSGYGAIDSTAEGEVIDIIEKKRSGKGIANTGLYIVPCSFFEHYQEIPVDEKSGEYFLTNAVSVLKKHGVSFRLKKVSFWFGVNTPEQLKKARELTT